MLGQLLIRGSLVKPILKRLKVQGVTRNSNSFFFSPSKQILVIYLLFLGISSYNIMTFRDTLASVL